MIDMIQSLSNHSNHSMRKNDSDHTSASSNEELNRRREQMMSDPSTKVKVSPSLELSQELHLNSKELYKVPLIPVNCSFGIVKEQTEKTTELRRAVVNESQGRDVTLMFVVRRPGCSSCREHGLQLTQLAKEEKIGMMGAIKDTDANTDKEFPSTLLEFYQEYFRFPIYKDNKWKIYKAMGFRKTNIFQALAAGIKMMGRHEKKGIKNVATGGDPWVLGGVLIFDKKGRLRYCHHENIGEEINIEEIRQAIWSVRREDAFKEAMKNTARLGDESERSFATSTSSN